MNTALNCYTLVKRHPVNTHTHRHGELAKNTVHVQSSREAEPCYDPSRCSLSFAQTGFLTLGTREWAIPNIEVFN